jgi:hypothetical protein
LSSFCGLLCRLFFGAIAALAALIVFPVWHRIFSGQQFVTARYSVFTKGLLNELEFIVSNAPHTGGDAVNLCLSRLQVAA